MSADDGDGGNHSPLWVGAVTVDEVARQRSLGWPDWHPEDFCHRCGRRNPIWTTPDWQQAFPSDAGIVCPSCFAHLADPERSRIWEFRQWEVTPDEQVAALTGLLEAVAALGDDAGRVARCIVGAGWLREGSR